MEFPNWLKIVLLLLSFESFLPQLRLLWLRRDSSGISLYYVLFNLVVATEIFTIDLAILTGAAGSDIFVHTRASTGDWLNLVQFGTVWAMWARVYVNPLSWWKVGTSLINCSPPSFIACIVFYPRELPRIVPASVSTIYTCCLLISLVPFITVSSSHGSKNDRKWFDALFVGLHVLYLNLPITILGVASVYPQVREILRRPGGSGPGALSLVGLAAQAVLFLFLPVGFSWFGRLVWPYPVFGRALSTWSQLVGYVPIDHFIFAVVQAVLLYIAVRHSGWHARVEPVDEARPAGASERESRCSDGVCYLLEWVDLSLRVGAHWILILLLTALFTCLTL